jgi:hypothetical protein
VKANYSGDNEVFLPTKHGGGLSIKISDRVTIAIMFTNFSEISIKFGDRIPI